MRHILCTTFMILPWCFFFVILELARLHSTPWITKVQPGHSGKPLILCSPWKSYGFRTTWGCVSDDIILFKLSCLRGFVLCIYSMPCTIKCCTMSTMWLKAHVTCVLTHNQGELQCCLCLVEWWEIWNIHLSRKMCWCGLQVPVNY